MYISDMDAPPAGRHPGRHPRRHHRFALRCRAHTIFRRFRLAGRYRFPRRLPSYFAATPPGDSRAFAFSSSSSSLSSTLPPYAPSTPEPSCNSGLPCPDALIA